MPTPSEKLARSLRALRELQQGGRRVFKSDELSRTDRERLLEHRFLRQVMKGWLLASGPDALPGDTTPWYASFWEFCSRYCTDRFGEEWHLSPEQSLLLEAGDTSIPGQVVVYSPHGTNNTVELLFDTSIYDLKQDGMPPADDLLQRDGLRIVEPAAALTKVPGSFYARHPIEARVVLSEVGDASEVLRRLLEGGHSTVAGRLAGGFRRIGRPAIADEIVSTMESAGYRVRERDPFETDERLAPLDVGVPAFVRRLEAMWASMRETVIEVFPSAPGLPGDPRAYLRGVDDLYERDAYHSLSIEGYEVTEELIHRVRTGDWDPEADESDRGDRDALAARGYWQAFQSVKEVLEDVLGGENPGTVVRKAHREWYRDLVQPFVAAGVLDPPALAGYRSGPVYIKDSRHVPPDRAIVPDAMPALFDLLEEEEEASVSAVLGHWMFGYIHPFPDGNGRVARFVMNVMLASGGHPWTVLRVEDRAEYMSALESASFESDIRPFAEFVAERVEGSRAELEG